MNDLLNLPVGRFVSGSITDKRTTGHDGQPLPEDKQRFEFGVAVRKDDAGLVAIFGAMKGEAASQHGALPAVQAFDLNGYSWKVTDGDKPNRKGQVNENTTGCYVFWFSSSYPPQTVNAQNTMIDATEIKRGYYVDVAFNVKNNGKSGQQAGIYVNPTHVRLIAYGEEIRGGIDANAAFANTPAPTSLPPGASATPVASTPAPGTAPAPAGNAAPAPAASPAQAAPAPNSVTASPTNAAPAPAPAHDFVQNATLPGGMPQS
jgi:hypothetical protein